MRYLKDFNKDNIPQNSLREELSQFTDKNSFINSRIIFF
jgi:hypothetical protein